MGDAHLYWHLNPRRTGDIENYGNNGKGPVWWYPMEKMYSDENRPTEEELEQMKSKLLIELEGSDYIMIYPVGDDFNRTVQMELLDICNGGRNLPKEIKADLIKAVTWIEPVKTELTSVDPDDGFIEA